MSVTINPERGESVCSGRLRPSGGSVIVTLPPHVLDQTGLAAGDRVALVEAADGFSIRPAPDVDGVPLSNVKLRTEGSSTVCTVTKALEETSLAEGDGVNISVPFDARRVNIRAEE